MTKLAETVLAFRLRRSSTTKATDHELQEYDNFTRYGHEAWDRWPGRRVV